tara:strand:+ start:234 stop:422 length:189 start_codon:yes stop_codon:yes gene_type:complete
MLSCTRIDGFSVIKAGLQWAHGVRGGAGGRNSLEIREGSKYLAAVAPKAARYFRLKGAALGA